MWPTSCAVWVWAVGVSELNDVVEDDDDDDDDDLNITTLCTTLSLFLSIFFFYNMSEYIDRY